MKTLLPQEPFQLKHIRIPAWEKRAVPPWGLSLQILGLGWGIPSQILGPGLENRNPKRRSWQQPEGSQLISLSLCNSAAFPAGMPWPAGAVGYKKGRFPGVQP